MSCKYDLEIIHKTDFDLVVNVKQDDNVTPFDLTDYTAEADIKNDFSDALPLDTFTVTITDALNGIILMELSEGSINALECKPYLYDLKIQNTITGKTLPPILCGKAKVLPSVTDL